VYPYNNNIINIIRKFYHNKILNITFDQPNYYGYNALIYAIQYGRIDIIQLLINSESNINYATKYDDETEFNKYYGSALFVACNSISYFAVEIVQLLLNKGANVNFIDNNGDNALIQICALKDTRFAHCIVQLLLEKGANINHANKNGNTALFLACATNKVSVTRLLLKNGANVKHINRKGIFAYDMTSSSTIVKLFNIKPLEDYLEEKNYNKLFDLCKLNIVYKINI
jgi:ankyrin repeat protein